jgi:hypothetical protein
MRLLLIQLMAGLAAAASGGEAWPAFPAGERLAYSMSWGLMNVGQATASSGWAVAVGRTSAVIRLTSRTAGFFDKVFPVDDVMQAELEAGTLLPYRLEKTLREGLFENDEVTEFDREHQRAIWRSLNKKKERSYAIQPDTRCVVSYAYWMRGHADRYGETNTYQVAGDKGLCQVRVRCEKFEAVEAPGIGLIPCALLVPTVPPDPVFDRKLPGYLWVSLDDRRLLVKGLIKVPVGHVRLLLSGVEGPGAEDWLRQYRGRKPGGKIAFDLGPLDAAGLRGPPDGRTSLAYEFCIPDTVACRAAVRRADPGVKFMAGSRGRSGCGPGDCLCLGDTHQKDYRKALDRLAALPFIARISECVFEK